MATHRALLLPWRDALRRYVAMPLFPTTDDVDEATRTRVVWLQWTQLTPARDDAAAARYLLAYAALEMLALVARIDYNTWLAHVADVWPRATARWVDALYPGEFQLALEVRAMPTSGKLTTWAQRAWPGEYPQAMPAAQRRMEDRLRALLVDARQRNSRFVMPEIPVRVVMPQLLDIPDEEYWPLHDEIVQLAKTNAPLRDATCWKPRFRFVEVRGDDVGIECVEEGTRYAEQILQCGVRVSKMCLFDFQLGEDPANIASLQRTIADPVQHGLLPVSQVIISGRSPCQTLDAIFSSLLCSDGIREITVESPLEFEDRPCCRERFLLWLALCVFGTHGCPSLETLHLQLPVLTANDIAVLERALRGGDVLCQLFPGGFSSSGSGLAVVPSDVQLTRPAGAAAPRTMTLPDAQEKLSVITSDDDWLSVLLPGWGQAWLPRSHTLQASLQETQEVIPLKPRPLQHLVLNLVDNVEHLQDLLAVVSARLRAISVRWNVNPAPASNEWIGGMCQMCPALETIKIERVSSDTLDILANCYEAGICKAKRLHVTVVDMVETEFFEWLADPHHAMTRHLRELSLVVRSRWSSIELFTVLESALGMLTENDRLWKLDILVKWQGPTTDDASRREQFAALDKLATQLDDQRQPIRADALTIPSKLAFLSTVYRAPRHSVRGDLDVEMARLIFQFAAERTIRRVRVAAA